MAKTNDKPEYGSTKRNVCQERQIKVNKIHYDYKSKQDTNRYGGSRAVPWIQMKGLWLEQAGFTINTPVKIRVMNGCLVLTTEEGNE